MKVRDFNVHPPTIPLEVGGFVVELAIEAWRDGRWISPTSSRDDRGATFSVLDIHGRLDLRHADGTFEYQLSFKSARLTRLRLSLCLHGTTDVFHLIPGNIHGDNNAAHVAPGQFPCLTDRPEAHSNFAATWEFRADRASHPVSILCTPKCAVGISIDPYSDDPTADDGYIANGVFATLPNTCGVSLGYGNDPLTFSEKTIWLPATADLSRGAAASGRIFAVAGNGRVAAHQIIRSIYDRTREVPEHRKSHREALAALAESFATVNWSSELGQYTNRKAQVPNDTTLKPWRCICEIGWTGGSMLAYPFLLAERIVPNLKMPKSGGQIFDEICSGFNEASGFINDNAINRFTRNRPDGWNTSEINSWWSGFLPNSSDNHCAYTNAHAAYYMLRSIVLDKMWHGADHTKWRTTALAVLDTAVSLQRADGAFGYIFSGRCKAVVDWDGFAGCWFGPALVHAWQITDKDSYLTAAARSLDYYAPFVADLIAWGSPMDTYKSIDSEGNLAFLRAARMMHEATGEQKYLDMAIFAANYEYLWRYGFRTRPPVPPLKGSNWNSCGGSITSVSNPHMHPMSVVATGDLRYLAQVTGDNYHFRRADDGLAWLMNTMELYPDVTGYGRYGVLSERTCPGDGLLAEQFRDTGAASSTWWSYNAWAAGSAMEALAEHILADEIRTALAR